MNNRPIVILAIIVLAICMGAVWFLQIQPKPSPAPTAGVATPVPEIAATPSPAIPRPSATAPLSKLEPKQMPAVPRELPEWETKIDQVLRSNVGETESAQLLINMLPTLPPDGQSEAAQHIANLILDPDYHRVLPLVKNPALPEEVLDVFVTDLMNREDDVKLPTLLEIAKLANHPHQEEALTDLQIFLDEDFGTDWVKWDQAMKKYLKEQAAENAADPAAPPVAGAPQPGVIGR